MSLGGFAYGLSQSIQKAEERYQDRIEREQARADRLAAQTAGFQFQEKMYKRRQEDAYKEKISERFAGLQSIFGSDERGQLLTRAFMPFDLESTRATVNDYKKKLEGSGVDFRDYFEVSNFDPEAGELPTLAKITQAFQARKEGKLDEEGNVIGMPEGFKLPTVGFKTFEPFSKPVRSDIVDLFTDDAFESAQKLDAAIEIAKENVNLGTPNQQNTAKRELMALQKLRVRNDQRIASTSGTTELEKSGYFSLAFKRVRDYKENVLEQFMVGRGEQRQLNMEGNRPSALSALARAYQNETKPNAPLFQTFKNNVQIDTAFKNAFDTDIVLFYNNNLETHVSNKLAEGRDVYKIYQNPVGNTQLRENEKARKGIATKGKGTVVIYVGEDGAEKVPVVVDTYRVNQNREAIGIKHFRPLSPISNRSQSGVATYMTNNPNNNLMLP